MYQERSLREYVELYRNQLLVRVTSGVRVADERSLCARQMRRYPMLALKEKKRKMAGILPVDVASIGDLTTVHHYSRWLETGLVLILSFTKENLLTSKAIRYKKTKNFF